MLKKLVVQIFYRCGGGIRGSTDQQEERSGRMRVEAFLASCDNDDQQASSYSVVLQLSADAS